MRFRPEDFCSCLVADTCKPDGWHRPRSRNEQNLRPCAEDGRNDFGIQVPGRTSRIPTQAAQEAVREIEIRFSESPVPIWLGSSHEPDFKIPIPRRKLAVHQSKLKQPVG